MSELTLRRIKAKAKWAREKENISNHVWLILNKMIWNYIDSEFYDSDFREFYKASKITLEYLKKIREIK